MEEKDLKEIAGIMAGSALPPLAERKIHIYIAASVMAIVLAALPFTLFLP